MKKRILSILLCLCMAISMLPLSAFAANLTGNGYGYEETPAESVTVYVTISNDGMPILGCDDAKSVMANQKVTVPYFDLAKYGLERFYRYHTENGQGEYTDKIVVERPTVLHLFIYLAERYYMGLPESECGKGTSGVLSYAEDTEISYFNGTPAYSSGSKQALMVGGSATSMFLNEVWGHDYNMKCYRNHAYPLMNDGWGATADYILLSDGDAFDLGLYSGWEFYMNGDFCCFDQNVYTAKGGETLPVSLKRWNAESNVLEDYSAMNVALYDANWKKVADVASATDGSSTIQVAVPKAGGTYYLLATEPDAGTENAVNAPAAARIEVEESGYLAGLQLGGKSAADSARFEMTPDFASDNHTYTVLVPDSVSSAYAWATLSEDAPADAKITAQWTATNGAERTAAITSGKASGQSLASFLSAGTAINTLNVAVGTEDDMQTYTVQVVRNQPTLTALSLDTVPLNETFAAGTFAYTAATTEDSVTILATPRDDSYTVNYNGSENNTVSLQDGDNTIAIKVVNADGYESVYTLTVKKVVPINVTIQATPSDAVVQVLDRFGDRVWPTDGVYTLLSSCEYTYTVTKNGYIGQKNTFSLPESGTIEVALEKAPENAAIDPTIYAQWSSFRGENNMGKTNGATPYAPEDAELLWATKYGTGWSAAPAAPIMVDGDLITYVGSTLKRIDRNTGAVLAEGTMAGASSFAMVSPTYADGMIFVGLSGGRVQAFNAKTLESLWLYTDALAGQPNCPITYRDGYVYTGFWNSEARAANFVCLSATDEDPTQTQETKYATWTYARNGGFYWAGAYVTDRYVLVGTDDGQSGSSSETASLLVLDRQTGAQVDAKDGIRGDIRSAVCYDAQSDRVFFTTKGGVLCNAKIDWDTGKITDFQQAVLQDAKGNEYAMSTVNPMVYNDRIYVGVAGPNQFGEMSGHCISVFDLNADGSMTNAYVYEIKGYPQNSPLLTTAYADAQEGYVYVYMTYNTTPGGIAVLKDKKGQTAPLTTTDQGYSEVFTPLPPLSQYCLCAPIADEYGTIYYKNDSLYMMAITSKIESISVAKEATAYSQNEDGTWNAEGLQVVANLKNGTTRDVTDYIVVTQSEENGNLVAAYTYGFDHENYGLKTLTVELCSLCTAKGHDFALTVVAPNCEADGYNLHQCERCGYNYRDQFVPALGHAYQQTVTEPTCTEQGYTTHTCTVCGESYVDTVVPALGHTYQETVTEPTCTKQGYTTHTCTVCGNSYVDAIVPATGHDYETVVTEPTHDTMGYTTHTCKTCGASYVDAFTDALGHTYTSQITKEPTCTEEGQLCFTCDCGTTYTQPIPMVAHDYEAVVTEPTCTQMGYTTYTCKNCDHSYVAEFVAATGHSWQDEHVDATCVGYGYTMSKCTNCGESAVRDLQQPLGHNYELTGAREATCTEEGYTGDMICTRCADVGQRGEVIPMVYDDCPTASFADLNVAAWYHKAVDYVVHSGYMFGMDETHFGPDKELTRGQLIATLYRVEGQPEQTGENPFVDVKGYYERAICWAAANKIASGVGNGRFAPDASVTREQMVSFVARYAKYLGKDIADKADLQAFADSEEISAYAVDAMAWAVKAGILSGVGANRLAPKGTANRAQAASILQRLDALLK